MIPEPRTDNRNEIEIDFREKVSSPPPLVSSLLSQTERAEDLVITGTAVLTFQYTYKSRSREIRILFSFSRSALLFLQFCSSYSFEVVSFCLAISQLSARVVIVFNVFAI
jgi:hypothetical protein